MSRIEELIAELCPDGVEIKAIGEIATDVYRGSGITRDQVVPYGISCVRYGEIYTTYGIWFDECVSHTEEAAIQNPKYFEHGDILFAITGENVADIAKSTAYVGHEKCLAGGDMVVLKHNQNPKYLSYVLSTADAQKHKSAGKVKSKVVHSSVPAIKAIEIPIPPLSIQEEIVRILDTFTELTTELKAELNAERTARKQQYEYYQNKMLDFSEEGLQRKTGTIRKLIDELCPDGVEYKNLDEMCMITRGRVMSKDYLRANAGVYPVYSSQTLNNGIFGYIDNYDYDFESITWTTDGANAGSVFFHSNEKFSITNVCGLLSVSIPTELCTRFLFYWLQSIVKDYVSPGMGNPKLMSNSIARVPVLVPPLPIQEEIVRILDQFDLLCNDLTTGLPAEIEARQQQYEYYRDKLLSFEKAM